MNCVPRAWSFPETMHSRNARAGVIESLNADSAAVELNVLERDDLPAADMSSTLENFGLIEGAAIAVLGGDGQETVINRGRIIGDVDLGFGDDTFVFGSGGGVDGALILGGGDDFVHHPERVRHDDDRRVHSRRFERRRSRHAMAYDAGRHRLVLFGGLTGFGDNLKTLADTWEWNGEYWMQVADTGPSERHDTAMAYDASIGRVVLYGGSGLGSTQTWEWDGEAWTQTESEIGPGQQIGHAMAYDDARKRVVLFGGEPLQQGEATGTNDTWERNGAVWARVADTGPERTHFPAMAFDSKRVILFGGRAGSGSTAYTSGATWQWDGKHWAQRGDFGPGPRFALAMAYDGARDRVVRCSAAPKASKLLATRGSWRSTRRLRRPEAPLRRQFICNSELQLQ